MLVDQSPIGRTPRSNPVTYIKAFDLIREAFASHAEADRRGYTAGPLLLQHSRADAARSARATARSRSRCSSWPMSSWSARSAKARATRASILEVRYKDLNIHEVLQLTVREAIGFFSDIPKLVARLKVLNDVGLGYLRLGQSATTLSGGEAQRVKLAGHLRRRLPARERCSSSMSRPPACTSTTSRSCSMPSSG